MIKQLERDLKDLKKWDAMLEVEKIKTHMLSLRGLINRRLQKDMGLRDIPDQDDDRKDFKGGILPI